MATPNAEQLKAIEHNGGVLLKAGAGSGKTFVLKEHMIYLAKQWIGEFLELGSPRDEFSNFAKNKLRKIVLMTFTKKAAGELAIRLHTEFKNMLEDDEEHLFFWENLVENLSYLNVSTIHGFCFRLIKMGFFPGISAEQKILTDSEYTDVLYEIFDRYLDKHANNATEREFIHLLLKDKQNVFNSIKGIFADPTLRLSWRNVALKLDENDLNSVMTEIMEDSGFAELFQSSVNYQYLEEFSGKPWFEFLNQFNQFARGTELSYSGFIAFYDFFKGLDFSIPRKPSGKTVPVDLIAYYEQVKNFKDYQSKVGADFVSYYQNYDSYVVPWLKLIKDMIDFIEAEYDKVEGVTFSDLEYIVYQNLQISETVKLIREEFQYFIVDEFQDTSFIQYAILESLIGNDFNKLFCVGDLKQAIYGFRGGELGVFLNCQKSIPLNLSLKNNYRSDRSIIEFNNIFFDDLFKRGNKYEGVDPHAVEVEHQTIPDTKEVEGEVYELSCDLSFLTSEEKISNLEVDYFEALALLDQIKKLKDDDGEIALLYKRLKPSLILINLLMQENIGFVAQTKIPFLEDPVIGVFYALIEREFNQNENAGEYQQMLIQAYINILAGRYLDINISQKIDLFYMDEKYYGLYTALTNFFTYLGLANSQFSQNLTFIETMILSAKNDKEVLYSSFAAQRESSYSLDFYFGENPTQVRIMTAHASKGLQFKHILLGGIYTNESSNISSPMIGKFPQSFKWSMSTIGKDKFKTPYYLLEEQVIRKKELSENKRLFYVANTRAESTLGWVNLNFGELKRNKNQYNSWYHGIVTWFSNHAEFTKFKSYAVNISKIYSPYFLAKLENSPPFFHINSLGVEFKEHSLKQYILPELSVTKLATLVDCPRKFYFQNICKFNEQEISLLEKPQGMVEYDQEEELTSRNILASSAARGTAIHESLSEIIKNNLDISDFDLGKDRDNILWAVEKLKIYLENSKLISEKPIKFELFGYMISGIPDLIIQGRDQAGHNEVWDFKTGKSTESKLGPYFFQLYAYAYAQFILGQVEKQKTIKLVLCFVDEQKLIDKNISFTDVENYLSEQLSYLAKPNFKNTNSCQYCTYNNICEK